MAIGRGSLARLTLLALLWGSSFLWIAIALRGFSPVQIVLIRLALGAVVLVIIVYARGLRLPTNRLVWLHLTVAALFANAISYTLFAIGEQHVSSSGDSAWAGLAIRLRHGSARGCRIRSRYAALS